jgi:hypothetical protein
MVPTKIRELKREVFDHAAAVILLIGLALTFTEMAISIAFDIEWLFPVWVMTGVVFLWVVIVLFLASLFWPERGS